MYSLIRLFYLQNVLNSTNIQFSNPTAYFPVVLRNSIFSIAMCEKDIA